jgi:hypothetical protein
MSDEERVYRNWQSGKIAIFDGDNVGDVHALDIQKRLSNFKASLVGLQRWSQDNGCTVYFLTLTMAKASWGNRTLNRYMNFLRARFKRRGLPFKYKWVLELQEQRYLETGVAARHWHMAVACPLGSLPNVEYLPNAAVGHHYHLLSDGFVVKQAELFKYWGLGQELCEVAYGSLVHYLSKYLLKNLESGDLGRRFGGSMLLWWRISLWAFEIVHEFYDAGFDVLKVWFTRGDVARLLHFKVTDGVTMEFYNVLSPWRRVESASVDA